ncbi:hypothetical protein CUU66_07210 [Peribacillus deserti]|uniref:Uncharacterized protein n=1 Tax=Peribacillus deserti TaxID=673318 RepID=A0A2N5M821_9BACI|nr:hypothetical protein CUU66_07210 [Peribacillus deserti]
MPTVFLLERDKKHMTNSEQSLYIKELGRLIDDYYKCPSDKLREQIKIDIVLLSTVLDTDKRHP